MGVFSESKDVLFVIYFWLFWIFRGLFLNLFFELNVLLEYVVLKFKVMIKRYLFGLIFDFVLDDIEEFVFVIFYRIIENLILVYIFYIYEIWLVKKVWIDVC